MSLSGADVEVAGVPPWSRQSRTFAAPLVDRLEPVGGNIGRPRKRCDRLLAGRCYDHDKYRPELWRAS